MTDGTSAVLQVGRRSIASVNEDCVVMEEALATMGFTAKEVSDRRWTERVPNGPIGFRSGSNPEAESKSRLEFQART